MYGIYPGVEDVGIEDMDTYRLATKLLSGTDISLLRPFATN